MEPSEIWALHRRAQAALGRIPGVLSVGIGLKETGGAITDQLALRIYVAEKKPDAMLSPVERIPDSFESVPTDVLVMDEIEEIAEDTRQYSPLLGGTNVVTFDEPKYSIGTLGSFATLNGVSGPENVVLLTCYHVLVGTGSKVGDAVYQPAWETVAGNPEPKSKDRSIGSIEKLPVKANYPFHYAEDGPAPADPASGLYYVDAATAKLDICVSSWCKTNCGISYKNEIRDLKPGPEDNRRIKGVARAQPGPSGTTYKAYKVGRTTGPTSGVITEFAKDINGQKRVMTIVGDGGAAFADHGDSGSALINDQNQIIGIVYSIKKDTPNVAYACHIHPAIDLLGITPISTLNPPVGPAGQARADIAGVFDGINHTIPLRERFVATPIGARAHATVLAHRIEVIGLVNHHRPVTIAWHRGKGPAFLAHAIENVRDPDHPIPAAIDGTTRAALLRRMAAVLRAHGSPALAAAIAAWSDLVFAELDGADDLHALVDRLEAVDG